MRGEPGIHKADAEVAYSLAEVLSSLSHALDLTSGHAVGHAQRTCLIGMRIAREIGLASERQHSLYHAMLMKDAGCSSNAARMYEIFGADDLALKQQARITDWSNLVEATKYAAANVLPHGPLLERARRILQIAVNPAGTTAAFSHSRCDRGAQIALAIGLGQDAAQCIRQLEEHWDGRGAPLHLKGDAISLLGRIATLAQTLEVFANTFDVPTAYEMLHKRSGKWFDPELVRAADTFAQDAFFWQAVQTDTRHALLTMESRAALEVATEQRIDTICDAFAQIIDAKSPFTAEHSSRVRDFAVEIGQAMGFAPARLTVLRRAALLHDVGKLGVSNAILDKPGKPDEDEWASIRKHPMFTNQILSHIHGFARLTEIASAHHERLDGKGYFRGLGADQLDLDMRILAVADVFDALSAKRPYRDALPLPQVFAILDKDAGIALDAECIGTLKEIYRDGDLHAPAPVTLQTTLAA